MTVPKKIALLLGLVLTASSWGCAPSLSQPDAPPLVIVPPAREFAPEPTPSAELVSEPAEPDSSDEAFAYARIKNIETEAELKKLAELTKAAKSIDVAVGTGSPLRGIGTGAGGTSLGGGGIGTIGVGGGGYGSGYGRLRSVSRLRIESLVVSGNIAKAVVQRVLRRRLSALRYCYESEMRSGKKQELHAVTTFVIDEQGRVPMAKARVNKGRHQAFEKCIKRSLLMSTFPAPSAGRAKVLYRIRFRPPLKRPTAGHGGAGAGTGFARPARPSRLRPRIDFLTPQVSNGYSASSVQHALRRRSSVFQYCYERVLKSNPSFRGKLRLDFVIQTNGRAAVKTAAITPQTNAPLVGCLSRAVHSLTFPRPKAEVKVLQVATLRPR